MPTFIADEKIVVTICSTIADVNAPTLTEINAGNEVTRFLRSLVTPLEASSVDSSTAESKFNKTTAGTYGGQALTATFTRDDVYADDDAWTALPRGTTGYFVICDRGGSGATYTGTNRKHIAAGDRVDVWPFEVMSRQRGDYSRNQLVTFDISASVPSVPGEDVVVTAS